MIKYNKKKYLLFLNILIIVSLLTIDIKSVYAEDYCLTCGTDTGQTGNNSSQGGTSSNKKYSNEKKKTTDDEWELTCQWNVSTSSSIGVYANAYIDGVKKDINNLPESLAGRHIGLYVYEEKRFTKTARFYNLTKTRKEYKCIYCPYQLTCTSEEPKEETPKPGSGTGGGGTIKPVRPNFSQVQVMSNKGEFNNIKPIVSNQKCTCGAANQSWTEKTVYNEKSCNLGYGSYISGTGTDKSRPPSQDDYDWCYEEMRKSISTSVTLSPSYEIKYNDSNDINTKETSNDQYNTMKTVTGTLENACNETLPTDGETMSYSKTCKWHYNRNNVCINVKNGKVRYVNNSNACNASEYYLTPPSDTKYWYYFIPLNTKSTDGFTFEMNSSKSRLSEGICLDIINNNEFWKNRITDANGKKFDAETSKTKAKEKVKGGCFARTIITIPVEQKFYNEQTDGTFKGFNFYYKPIDVNNPFPNGLPSNSIWTTETISKIKGTSNQNVTYYANVTNAKAIRDYKNKETNYKKNLYTSWENMQLNGVSNFIENEGFVKRYVQKTDFYKLGCGPANEKKTNSDGTTNYLYQQECGT